MVINAIVANGSCRAVGLTAGERAALKHDKDGYTNLRVEHSARLPVSGSLARAIRVGHSTAGVILRASGGHN